VCWRKPLAWPKSPKDLRARAGDSTAMWRIGSRHAGHLIGLLKPGTHAGRRQRVGPGDRRPRGVSLLGLREPTSAQRAMTRDGRRDDAPLATDPRRKDRGASGERGHLPGESRPQRKRPSIRSCPDLDGGAQRATPDHHSCPNWPKKLGPARCCICTMRWRARPHGLEDFQPSRHALTGIRAYAGYVALLNKLKSYGRDRSAVSAPRGFPVAADRTAAPRILPSCWASARMVAVDFPHITNPEGQAKINVAYLTANRTGPARR